MTISAADTAHDLAMGDRPIEAVTLMPAQGIECGSLKLAFPYAWAKSIVEDFNLTPVPNAPAWLVGAANVEGEIVPVFDVASWVVADEPDATAPVSVANRARLLVCGHGGDRAAIAFSGSARMVRYASDSQAIAEGATPSRLSAVVLAVSEGTPPYWVVDTQRLLDRLASELAAW